MNFRIVHLTAAALLTLAGVGLLYSGIFLPPIGVIDASVLVAFGEVSTFAGALFGIDYHYRYREK